MAGIRAETMGEACSNPRRRASITGRRRSVVVAALATLLVSAAAVGCQAQDGGALMRKMIAAYQHLTTYEGHSNVDMTLTSRGQVLRGQSITNQLQVQRPNKIALIVFNSGPTGTRSIYSDGSAMTIYDALPNRYTVGPAAPDMQKLLQLLGTSARVSAELDPLFFLCLDKLPARVTGLKAGGSKTVNLRESLIVTGVVVGVPATMPSGGKKTLATTTMHWTWYIDKQTFLLNKIEAHSDPVMMPVNVRQKNKVIRANIPVSLELTHNVSMLSANPPLDAGVFVFKAPAGAIEQRSASQMLKDRH